MLRINHPLAVSVFIALYVWGLVVYPFIKTERLRVTPSKVVAVAIAVGISIYNGVVVLLMVFLWPVSLIWFPEYWGNFTGSIRGPMIDQKSPPVLVSLMGWFFLVVFPIIFVWMLGRQP